MTEHLKAVQNLRQVIPPGVYHGLFPQNTRLPEFYGLPKTHKPGVPLRPVVAAFAGPLSPVSILVERILSQLLQFVPAHIKNTAEACHSMRKAFPDLKVPENTMIVTMDVVGLYPSIPINDGIRAVLQKLEEHKDRIDMLGLSTEDIGPLLELILNNNFFHIRQADIPTTAQYSDGQPCSTTSGHYIHGQLRTEDAPYG